MSRRNKQDYHTVYGEPPELELPKLSLQHKLFVGAAFLLNVGLLVGAFFLIKYAIDKLCS